MRALILAMALAFVAGCALLPKHVQPQPVAASCDSQCYAPCLTTDISWTFNATKPEAYDAIGDEVAQPLAQRVVECSRNNRHACHACLLRLQAAGVIVGVPPDPNP